MTRSTFFKHFELLADQPDAVAKMRELVLQLAEQGKVVTQNPKDESAEVLITKVRAAKERLTKELRIKALAADSPIKDEDKKRALPHGWAWAQLADLCVKLGAGSTPLGGKQVYETSGVKFLRSQNVYNDGLHLDDVAFIPPAIHKEMSGTWVQPGDILLNITGASIGRSAIVPDDFDEANVSQHVAIVRLAEKALRQFLHLVVIAPDFQQRIMDVQVGVSREGLSMTRLKEFVVAIPPLAEQRRIVAKVDELMALCDELEQRQQARQHARGHVTQSAFHHLTAATDPAEFRKRFDFILHNSSFILDDVPQLRQAILQLAVQGRLDANANLWPAEPKPLGQFAPLQNGYAFKSEWFVPKGVRLLRNANISHDELRWNDMECIASNRVKEFERFELAEGDVVLSLDRPFISTGIKVARVRKEDLPCLLLQRVGRFQPDTKQIHPDYLFLWLNSPHFTSQIDPGRSNGVPHISSKQVEASEIFVPPLTEQKRIVARVEELLRWCDTLESQLHQTRTLGAHLLASTLHHLLAA